VASEVDRALTVYGCPMDMKKGTSPTTDGRSLSARTVLISCESFNSSSAPVRQGLTLVHF